MKENKYVYKEAKTSFGQIDKRQHELVTHVEFNKYINEFLTQGNHQDDALVEMYGVASDHETRLETAEDTLKNHTQQLVNHEMRVTKAEGTLVNHDNRITHNTNMNNAQDEVINNINERLKVVEDNNADFKVVTVFANNVQKVESFVATQGQTLFTLQLASYIPGQNRLAVYVDGVQQTINDGFVELDSRNFKFTEGLQAGMKVTARYFTEETSDDLTDILESIVDGPAILDELIQKGEQLKADSILIQPTKPLPEDNCDIWFDTSEDDFFVIDDIEVTSLEGVALSKRLSEITTMLENKTNCVFLEDFGVIGDGVTDDYINFQKAVDYACDNHLTLICKSNKTFYISQPILITKRFHIDLYNAEIVCSANQAMIIDVGSENGATAQSYLQRVTFDCSQNQIGLSIKARRVYLKNIYFKNITATGLSIDDGYEVDVYNCNFKGTTTQSKGIIINATDIHVSHCYGTDVNTFIINNADGNRITHCHSWIWDKSILVDSVFADLITSALVSNCVSDTYSIGFRMSCRSTSRIIGNNFIVHPDVYNKSNYITPPTFIHFTDTPPVYRAVIKDNWVSFPDKNLTGYDTPGELYNIDKIQVCCEVSGNTGYNVDMFNTVTAVLNGINGNNSTRKSYAIRKGNRVSLKAYVAFDEKIPTTDTVVFKLPDLMRPFSNFGTFGCMGTDVDNISNTMYVYITSDGDVIIKNATGDNTMKQGIITCDFDIWQPGIDLA